LKILITGGRGFIGRMLIEKLKEKGHNVATLSRSQTDIQSNIFSYDSDEILKFIGEEAYAIINLAGENISSKKWSVKQKKVILDSRLNATKLCKKIIDKSGRPPELFIQGSAIGYYGFDSKGFKNEKSSAGTGFLAEVTQKTEKYAAESVNTSRMIFLRTGVVLSKNGGALKKLLLPFRFFAGGKIGTGQQWFSWIHHEDYINAIIFLIENKSSSGIYNLTAPRAVTQGMLAKSVGRILHRPAIFPVPGFVLKLIFGLMAKEVLLGGQRVIPERLIDEGFDFRFPEIDEALKNILNK